VAASLVSLAGADGTENWVAAVDSPTSVSPGQVAADGLHIAFVGTLEGATTARLGGLEVAVSDGGGFLARVDLDGTPLWVTTLASASAPFLAVAEDGSHFLAGQFDDSATLAPGTPGAIPLQSDATAEVFFARLDVDGVPLWAATAHTNPDGVTMPSGIAVGADGHPVVIGYFAQGVTFGAGGPGEAMLVSQSQLDGYVARFDPDGDFQCVRHLRGEGPGLAMPLGIHARSDRTFEINGLFGPSIALSAGTLDEHILPSAGELDAFTSRYAYPMAP